MRYKSHITKGNVMLLILVLIFSIETRSQETLRYVSTMPGKSVNKLKAGVSIELPFFDDFTDSYSYPNPLRWADNSVFINDNYGLNPPSYGVATFDAVDNNGNFYKDTRIGYSFFADTLTSNPINLNYPSDQTIYLSFHYQSGGFGDFPDEKDSIFLDFYAPETETWNNVWNHFGDNVENFRDVILQINNSIYLQDGFKFRFRNKASFAGDNADDIGNCDHWNIDYVYLNTGRTSVNTINDLAFFNPIKSTLRDYESMPWKHFLPSFNDEALYKNFEMNVRNNADHTRYIDTIKFTIHDNSGDQPNVTITAGTQQIPAFQFATYPLPFKGDYLFEPNSYDSTSYTFSAKIVTNVDDRKSNNTQVYVQKFYDYYAYDDGTAETSYGIRGDRAKLACKFNCMKEDTLKAIQMCFNKSFSDEQKYFYLTIWNDKGGLPGDIIYKQEAVKPEYEGAMNKFHTYLIVDSVLVISGAFYVGWIQTTKNILNLGFDINRDNKKNNYIYINGYWENSAISGSLMIRPFFGKNITLGVDPVKPIAKANTTIYPNPTNGIINIKIDNTINYQDIKVSIYSLSGSLIKQVGYTKNQPLDVSDLNPGTYVLQLTDKSRKLNSSHKLIKQY